MPPPPQAHSTCVQSRALPSPAMRASFATRFGSAARAREWFTPCPPRRLQVRPSKCGRTGLSFNVQLADDLDTDWQYISSLKRLKQARETET